MPDPMMPGGPAPETPPPADPSQMPPGMSPGQPTSADQTPVTPEQKQDLLDMIKKVQAKLGAFHATNFASQNKLESIRSTILKQVFQKLQLAGVDLTSQDSVSAFLAKLQQESPELAQNFEKAMDALLGGAQAGPIQPGMASAPQDPTQSTVDLGVPQQ